MEQANNNSGAGRWKLAGAEPRHQEQHPIKRFRRYHGYDYTRGASLFITIVTEPRQRWFGEVIDAKVKLTPLGEAVDRAICDIPKYNPAIKLFSHVVMPDHIHFDIHIEAGHADAIELIGSMVRRFKTWTATVMRKGGGSGSLWQDGYHDRICSSAPFMRAVARYIKYNPLKYELRRNHPEYLAIHEPLDNARLNPEEFWRGIGNTALLDAEKIMAVRISRKVQQRDFARMIARFRKGAADGWIFAGGWISPGEKAVRDALLANGGRLIQILPSMMAHDYMPSNMYFEAIQQGRALILAKGNEEIEFSRAACLDLNAEAIALAGSSVYWRETGPAFDNIGAAS